MKILHVSHGCLPDMSGGVEGYLDAVVTEQRRQGADVTLLAGSHELRPETCIEPQQVGDHTVYRLYRDDLYFDLWSKGYCPSAELAFDRFLTEHRPDVVHVHQWIRLTSNLVEIAARRGVPAIVTCHDVYTSCPRCFRVRRDDEACERPLSVASCLGCVPKFGHESERELAYGIELYRDQCRAELEQAACVLVSDPATRDMIAAMTPIDPELFSILPLPYERRFKASPAAYAPGADEPLRFANWGMLTYRKGAQVLVEAFRDLCRAGPPRPVELHLFGGIDTDALETELRELGRDVPVSFHGRYEYDQLAAAGLHVSVFPTLCFETWGFVLDESFELGLPCVTTENGALARRAGDAAITVPPRDVDALRGALTRVATEPGLLDRMRAVIPPLPPTVTEHVERLEAIYRRAVKVGPSTPSEPIEPARRAQWLALQRESALGRVIPPGGPR